MASQRKSVSTPGGDDGDAREEAAGTTAQENQGNLDDLPDDEPPEKKARTSAFDEDDDMPGGSPEPEGSAAPVNMYADAPGKKEHQKFDHGKKDLPEPDKAGWTVDENGQEIPLPGQMIEIQIPESYPKHTFSAISF